MKKTFSINISGVGFVIDDDAYDMLGEYLDTLRHAFARTDGSEDLLQDIELRIAELLCERPGGQNAIVSLADVEKVIAQMGRPEDMDVDIEVEDASDGASEEVRVEASEPPVYTPKVKRRLYRDPEHRMVGGVCAGLAAYLDVDVTWVRLAVVAITILSFSVGALGYLILWIVVPDAVTPTERLQMRGEAPTLENIGRVVRDSFGGEQPVNVPSRHSFADGVAAVAGVLAKIAIVIFLVIAFPVLLAVIVGFVVCVCALIAAATCSVIGLQHPSWFGHDDVTDITVVWGMLCAIGYMLILGVPVALLVHRAIRSWRKSKPLSTSARRSFIIVWIVGLVLAGISTGMLVAYDNAPRHSRSDEPVSMEVTDGAEGSVVIVNKTAEDSVVLGLKPAAIDTIARVSISPKQRGAKAKPAQTEKGESSSK